MFLESKITSIVIPEGIVSIARFAFSWCVDLTSVKIPLSVNSIDDDAFSGCPNLQSISIPGNMTHIGIELFIGSGITTSILVNNNGVLCYVPKTYESYNIPNTVTSIAGGAFELCKEISSLYIPDGVTTIGENAFLGCEKLSTIRLPDDVSYIGMQAFAGVSVDVPILIQNNSVLCYVPTAYTSYDIPKTVTTINSSAFYECRLQSVTIPDNVTKIGDYAFNACKHLLVISIPDSVVYIGDGAFNACPLLKSVAIPKNITFIGSGVFNGTGIEAPILSTDKSVLYYVPDTYTSFDFPSTVTEIHAGALEGCHYLESISIPNKVNSIGDQAFLGDDKLQSVIVPNGVEKIGAGVFTFCSGLQSITIPNSVVSISDSAFIGCNNLTTIYGCSGSYAQTYASQNGIAFSNIVTATPNTSTVMFNGKPMIIQAYTIAGNNYFKLRDIAMAFNSTSKQFNVGWDGANNAITITSNAAYTPVGGELSITGSATKANAILSSSQVYIDGKEVNLAAYQINGNNYFKLRDVGQALNFGVAWDGSSNTIKIDTATGYTT